MDRDVRFVTSMFMTSLLCSPRGPRPMIERSPARARTTSLRSRCANQTAAITAPRVPRAVNVSSASCTQSFVTGSSGLTTSKQNKISDHVNYK